MNEVGINVRDYIDAEESVLLDEAGKNLFEIEGTEPRTSKKDGPCAQIRFRVIGGKNDGKVFVGIFSLLPQAIYRFKALVENCGKDASSIQDTAELVGCRVKMEVIADDYQGEKRLKPASFESAD